MLTPVTLVKNIFKETSKVKWVEANSASWNITFYGTILFVEVMNTKKLQITEKYYKTQNIQTNFYILYLDYNHTHKKTD